MNCSTGIQPVETARARNNANASAEGSASRRTRRVTSTAGVWALPGMTTGLGTMPRWAKRRLAYRNANATPPANTPSVNDATSRVANTRSYLSALNHGHSASSPTRGEIKKISRPRPTSSHTATRRRPRRRGRRSSAMGRKLLALRPNCCHHAVNQRLRRLPCARLRETVRIVHRRPIRHGYRTGVYSRMPQPRSKIHIAFEIGVVLKGINGLLELIGGFVLLWIGPGTLQNLVVRLTQNELSEDPRDFIATHLREAAGHLSDSAQLFAAIYLLAHGVIKSPRSTTTRWASAKCRPSRARSERPALPLY